MAEQARIPRLIERAKSGDRAAFDALNQEFSGKLGSFVRSRLRAQYRQQLEIDELVQDTFTRAFQSMERFQGEEGDSFFGWLAGIAKNAVLKAIEKRQRDQCLEIDREIPAGSASPSKVLRRGERFDRLQKAIENLSGEYRQVILLCRIEGLPIAKVAEQMQRSPDAVKKLLWRALKELKKTFGETESFHLPQRSLGLEGENHGE